MTFRGPHTEETKRRIAESVRDQHQRGPRASPEAISEGVKAAYARGKRSPTRQFGEHHPGWKGDAIAYRTAHKRVERARGKPHHCEHCGTNTAKRFEWALSRDASAVITDDRGRRYSAAPADYLRLCSSCHITYDREEST